MMRTLVAVGTLLMGLGAAMGQPLSGNIAIHDPSIAVLEAGMVSFATGVENAGDGGQLRTKSSVDGLDWQEAGALPVECRSGLSRSWVMCRTIFGHRQFSSGVKRTTFIIQRRALVAMTA